MVVATTSSTTSSSRVRKAGRKRGSVRRQRLFYGSLGIIAVLVPWELLVRSGAVDPVLIGSPVEVARTLVDLFKEGTIWTDLWVSFKEWSLGFVMASVAGIIIGGVAGWFRWVRYIAEPWLNVLYAIPELALIPIFILWFGIGLEFKVWLAFLSAIFVVAINTMAGVHSTEAKYLAVSTTYGASRMRVFRTVVLPGSVPYIITGLRQASGRALVGIIGAEFLSANQGIGFFISLSGQTINTNQVMAGVILLAAFGILTGEFFRLIEQRFDVWRRQV
jgi:ABC-type nitrate/sulfonate/bicarbonate transport system permease component